MGVVNRHPHLKGDLIMIVLKKDGHFKPVVDFEEAQKDVNAGWDVHINKSGKKLLKQAKKRSRKSTKK
tara:strand:+ start:5720 stop:5923 length:204 start_codon:yes stop_codon:yes gene_type:complete